MNQSSSSLIQLLNEPLPIFHGGNLPLPWLTTLPSKKHTSVNVGNSTVKENETNQHFDECIRNDLIINAGESNVRQTRLKTKSSNGLDLSHPSKLKLVQHVCPICEKIFDNSMKLGSHMFDHLDDSDEIREPSSWCNVCHRDFRTVERLSNHNTLFIETLSCCKCHNKFNTESNLKEHTQSMHSSEDQLNNVCPICDDAFENLESHLLTHSDYSDDESQNYACDLCYKNFSSSSNLQKHIDYHVKRLSCCYCAKKYLYVVDLEEHFRTKHQLFEQDITSQSSKNKSDLQCHLCCKTFRSLQFSRVHRLLYKTRLSCCGCSQLFLKSEDTSNHVHSVGRNFDKAAYDSTMPQVLLAPSLNSDSLIIPTPTNSSLIAGILNPVIPSANCSFQTKNTLNIKTTETRPVFSLSSDSGQYAESSNFESELISSQNCAPVSAVQLQSGSSPMPRVMFTNNSETFVSTHSSCSNQHMVQTPLHVNTLAGNTGQSSELLYTSLPLNVAKESSSFRSEIFSSRNCAPVQPQFEPSSMRKRTFLNNSETIVSIPSSRLNQQVMQSHLSMSLRPKKEISSGLVGHAGTRKENNLNHTTLSEPSRMRAENGVNSVNPKSIDLTSEDEIMEKNYNSSKYSHTIKPLDHYTCGDCGIRIVGWMYLKHARSHNDLKPFKCCVCDQRCRRYRTLSLHFHRAHLEKKMKCEICNKKYSTAELLSEHVRKFHTDRKSITCDKCSEQFKTPYSLTTHQVLVHGDNWHECEICDKKFLTKLSLGNHKKRHSNFRPFICEICCKGFVNSPSLNRHMVKHSDSRTFPCSDCSSCFKSLDTLKQHALTHEKNQKTSYKCDLCHYIAYKKQSLIRHLLVHSQETPFVCGTCGKGFKTKARLITHMPMHTKARTHICKMCEKAFLHQTNLLDHMRAVHRKDQHFICNICGKSLTRKQTWKQHMKTHEHS